MRFLLVLAILSAFIAFGHWTIYRAIVSFWRVRNARIARTLRVSLAILSVSFIALTFATSAFSSAVGAWLYAASAVWLGTATWLFAASAVGLLAALGFRLLKQPRISRHMGQVLILGALAVSAYGVVHSYDTRVTRYTASLPGLPEAWQGKTVAFIADTHLGNVRGVAFSEKIASMVGAEEPDMLLIAGDFFDGPPADYRKLAEPFGKLDLPHGVIFANGNHEEFGDKRVYDVALEEAGVTVLSDVLLLIDGLQIAGVDYSTSNDDATASTTLAAMGISAQMPAILIKHVPNALDATEAAGVDLQVSGHTHGGQSWPMSMLVRALFGKFIYGHNDHGTLQVITTSGAGTWGPPQRVGTDPEIVVITLERAR